MTFEFRAHHSSAYSRFAVMLVLLIAINLLFISIYFPSLKFMNDAAKNSVILIVPWLLILLLPSVILGILIYRSFVKTFRFTPEKNFLIVELLNKNKTTVIWQKKLEWKDLKSVRIVDFEDNHYCNLEFEEKKNNLVIHRESGAFDEFYEELKKFAPLIA